MNYRKAPKLGEKEEPRENPINYPHGKISIILIPLPGIRILELRSENPVRMSWNELLWGRVMMIFITFFHIDYRRLSLDKFVRWGVGKQVSTSTVITRSFPQTSSHHISRIYANDLECWVLSVSARHVSRRRINVTIRCHSIYWSD